MEYLAKFSFRKEVHNVSSRTSIFQKLLERKNQLDKRDLQPLWEEILFHVMYHVKLSYDGKQTCTAA